MRNHVAFVLATAAQAGTIAGMEKLWSAIVYTVTTVGIVTFLFIAVYSSGKAVNSVLPVANHLALIHPQNTESLPVEVTAQDSASPTDEPSPTNASKPTPSPEARPTATKTITVEKAPTPRKTPANVVVAAEKTPNPVTASKPAAATLVSAGAAQQTALSKAGGVVVETVRETHNGKDTWKVTVNTSPTSTYTAWVNVKNGEIVDWLIVAQPIATPRPTPSTQTSVEPTPQATQVGDTDEDGSHDDGDEDDSPGGEDDHDEDD